ncbi:MarR family winged helix-turn-helix transcriptional regulator [Phytoactinopolyspora halotolerans]|uniref:Winged helix-turn-helix transcriptional regulator n=1 Tax=Phytoactinopolyspora halotolerans TaxID=1981512 RepID=A0A6L9SIR8_9ACTN|nr:MarR family winged helix-turn-helix transcriptional regulator [Phytoactinopolyspora halotolerans]NEE04564.1 winged helix-turn-helix transcriptional regulator [Phytoactinopolyspora halotolerans]
MSPVTPSSAASASAVESGLTSGRALAGLLIRLDVHRRLVESRSPLGIADARLLWLLADRGPRTLREIADALGLEQSTVNRQVNGALKEGLVRRIDEPGRPARLIEPTEDGLSALEAATSMVLGTYEAGLAALGDQDVTQFLELLERFVEAYGEAVRA